MTRIFSLSIHTPPPEFRNVESWDALLSRRRSLVERDGNWRGPSGERIEEKMFGFNSGAGNVNHISCENWERFMKYPRPREARLFQIALKLRTVGWNGGAE